MDHHHRHKEAFKGRYFYSSQFEIGGVHTCPEVQDQDEYHDLPIRDHLINIIASVID